MVLPQEQNGEREKMEVGLRCDSGDFADACGSPYHWGYDFPDFAKRVHVRVLIVVDADVLRDA